MFHNPFNNKFVKDIQNFLNEHRNDINIDPCLDEHAKKGAEWVAEEAILEERRNIMTTLFNEAVAACGCRGTTKEATDFTKAIEKYVAEKAAVVPGKKISIPAHDKSELETPAVVAKKTEKPASKSNLGKNDGLSGKGKNPPKIGG